MAARSGNEPSAGRGTATGPPGGRTPDEGSAARGGSGSTAGAGVRGDQRAPLRKAHSANDRFKGEARRWFWISLAASVVLHFAVLAYWPSFVVVEQAVPPAEMVALIPPPVVELPEIPAAPERPAIPAEPVDLDPGGLPDAVLADPAPDFGMQTVPPIPPPPTVTEEDWRTVPGLEDFIPVSVAPELRNRAEVTRALRARYPRHLQARGIGGRVVFLFWIDENGDVRHFEMTQSSGRKELDEAALDVVEMMRFSPALNHGRPTRVVVALPIVFEVR